MWLNWIALGCSAFAGVYAAMGLAENPKDRVWIAILILSALVVAVNTVVLLK